MNQEIIDSARGARAPLPGPLPPAATARQRGELDGRGGGPLSEPELPADEARRAILGPRAGGLVVLVILLTLSFGRPLYDLAQLSLHNGLYSHILLIPCISLYLAWLKKRELALGTGPAAAGSRGNCQAGSLTHRWWPTALMLSVGFIPLAGYWLGVSSGWRPQTVDYLALMTLSYICLLLGGCFALFGAATLRTLAFPATFLFFTVPFPDFVYRRIEDFLQQGSAEAAYWFLKLSGTPVFRQGTELQLPGFGLEVAPECSGIHSSLVLLITSLLAGHLLLRSRWTKAVLALAVIPLGIVRNGLRIFTLGQLCIHVNPAMINSDLHRRGGPLFFAISLAPLFFLLLYFRKLEHQQERGTVKRVA